MPYIIELVSLGEDLYVDLDRASALLNSVQTEFIYRIPPERLRKEGVSHKRDEYVTSEIFEWLSEYRERVKGGRPYLIACLNGPLRSEKWANLFGSHQAKKGLATFTLHNQDYFTTSKVAFLCYYFIRYTLNFIAPHIRTHGEDKTRFCFFHNKFEKTDIIECIKECRMCQACEKQIEDSMNPEIRESLDAACTMIKKLEVQWKILAWFTIHSLRRNSESTSNRTNPRVLPWWAFSAICGLLMVIVIQLLSNYWQQLSEYYVAIFSGMGTTGVLLFYDPVRRYWRMFSTVVIGFLGLNGLTVANAFIKFCDTSKGIKECELPLLIAELAVEGPSWHANTFMAIIALALLWLDHRTRN